MKTMDFFNWNGYQINKTEAWMLFQSLCDEVFGKGVVDIDCAESNNVVLMHLMFANMFETFYENLKAMLERLKEKMTSEEDKAKLIATIEALADGCDCKLAFAKLVTWDKLWDLIHRSGLDMDCLAIGLLDDTEDMNPYELAEKHRLWVMETLGDEIMDEDKPLVVLVKVPWNNVKCFESDGADAAYYRSLARRTFIEYYSDDETELYDISDYYCGDALVKDAIAQLNGIIVIDMTTGDDNDEVVIHSFKNPNSEVMTDEYENVLEFAVAFGDGIGMYEDFESDNY